MPKIAVETERDRILRQISDLLAQLAKLIDQLRKL